MNTTSNIVPILRSVCNQRQRLINTHQSKKNAMVCLRYITEIKRYVDAYEKTWSEESWKKFVCTHAEKIMFLIPETKSGKSQIKKIIELV